MKISVGGDVGASGSRGKENTASIRLKHSDCIQHRAEQNIIKRSRSGESDNTKKRNLMNCEPKRLI